MKKITMNKKAKMQDGWQDGSKAPKTGEQFLADVGYPWPVVAVYSEAENGFVYAELECSLYEGKNDPYYITEREKPENIKRWRPMPKL